MKHTLIVCTDPVVLAGVEKILIQELGLDIVRCSLKDDQSLFENIPQCNLVLLQLDENQFPPDMNFLLKLFMLVPEWRLIVVNPKENRLLIYEKEDIEIATSADFGQAVLRHTSETLSPMS